MKKYEFIELAPTAGVKGTGVATTEANEKIHLEQSHPLPNGWYYWAGFGGVEQVWRYV